MRNTDQNEPHVWLIRSQPTVYSIEVSIRRLSSFMRWSHRNSCTASHSTQAKKYGKSSRKFVSSGAELGLIKRSPFIDGTEQKIKIFSMFSNGFRESFSSLFIFSQVNKQGAIAKQFSFFFYLFFDPSWWVWWKSEREMCNDNQLNTAKSFMQSNPLSNCYETLRSVALRC